MKARSIPDWPVSIIVITVNVAAQQDPPSLLLTRSALISCLGLCLSRHEWLLIKIIVM